MIRRQSMRARSRKRTNEHRAYVAFVAAMAASADHCAVGRILAMHGLDPPWAGCWGRMSGLHHRRKRSAGGALMLSQNVLRCCNPCNTWIEDHPTVAHELGLVVRAGDPEWEQLAAYYK